MMNIHFRICLILYLLSSIRCASENVLCGLRTNELIEYYGYTAEEHLVTTEDGYILTIFRCNSKKESSIKKQAVILSHGILSSSDNFCLDIPERALPYILADADYDVWLINSRGNYYSRNHISLQPNEKSFWNFTWYEMGVYDHPAVIDYILKATNNSRVYYAGHSQGTTTMLVLLAEKPEYNDKIAAASLMAPIGYMKNTGSVLQTISKLEPVLKVFDYTEFLPRGSSESLSGKICSYSTTTMKICDNIYDSLVGRSKNQVNLTMYQASMCHSPNGASFKQFDHYGLEIKYDYFGKYKNDKSATPANFELWRIKVPIQLHYSKNDDISSPVDVNRLIAALNNSRTSVNYIDSIIFNHVDFIRSWNAASLIYTKILSFFQESQ